jgi:phosphoesterase RecJ-like protein
MKIKNSTDIDSFKPQLKSIIDDNQNFVITVHENSDGDAVGAEFALYLFLKKLKKNVRIVNQDSPSSKYDFLGLSSKVEIPYRGFQTSLPPLYTLFMLDYNEKTRAGKKIQEVFEHCKQIVCIDHHQLTKDTISAVCYIDPNASSVGEILYLLLKDDILDLFSDNKEKIATCLYSGIIYDTNNFANKNVSVKTFKIAGDLFALGVDNNLCYLNIFDNKSTTALKLLGMTLSTLELYELANKKKIAFYITTAKMINECDAKIELTEDFSDEVKPSLEREVVVYFRQVGKNRFRVSLRSLRLDVEQIAEGFGGGGHKLAAGFETEMGLEILKKKLIDLINRKLK